MVHSPALAPLESGQPSRERTAIQFHLACGFDAEPRDCTMPEMNRHVLLAGSAAAFAGSQACGQAFAAAPKTLTQGPGVYRQKLGDFQLTALYDGLWSVKIDDTFIRN